MLCATNYFQNASGGNSMHTELDLVTVKTVTLILLFIFTVYIIMCIADTISQVTVFLHVL